jgi:hypothetical protein
VLQAVATDGTAMQQHLSGWLAVWLSFSIGRLLSLLI